LTARNIEKNKRRAVEFSLPAGGNMSWFWKKATEQSGRRYQSRPILDRNRAKFFVRLCQAVPTFYVFPQVALSALLSAAAGKNQKADRARIAGMTVDYAIYNANLTLVCVINLDDGSADPDADAIAHRCFRDAGIKTIRWDAETRPTVDQIRRTMLSSINRAKSTPDAESQAAFESEVTIQPGNEAGGARREAPDRAAPLQHAAPIPLHMPGLSAVKLDQLTPGKVLQTNYPHIWQRITVFAIEPKHLKKYLLSLSMQDRAEKRAGFSLEALKEIADIQTQNDRFLTDEVRSWQPGFVNP
jgi:hypothetical protein